MNPEVNQPKLAPKIVRSSLKLTLDNSQWIFVFEPSREDFLDSPELLDTLALMHNGSGEWEWWQARL